MVREFEERAELLGHSSLVKDAAKFAEAAGRKRHRLVYDHWLGGKLLKS